MSTLAVPASARRSPLRTTLTFVQTLVFLFSLASPLTVLATDPTPAPDPSPTEAPAPSAPAAPSETPAPSAEPSSAPEAPRPFIVTFTAGTDVASQLAVLDAAGAISESWIPQLRMHAVALTSAQVSALNADASVARVDLDRTRDTQATPSDPSYADQWSLPKVGWDQLHGSVAIPGTATVAILDTGVDASHPDLDEVVLSGTSILDGSTGQTDVNGHGTWMAGIVAAETGNDLGVAGTAYAGVSILPVTVLGADGTGQDSDIISGVVYAADAGADVILMSFSSPGYSAALQAAIDYAWASGAVLVAATGNDGVGTSTFPAGDRGVVGVTSTDASDTLAASANFGPAAFMAAPGESIVTTGVGGGITTISGTSAAAGSVAGAAALLKANESSLSNGIIVSRLAANADPAGDPATTGNGRLNLLRAMEATSTEEIQPAGAAPVGDGGPFVGPYVIASNADVVGLVRDAVTGLPIAGATVTASGSGTGTDVTDAAGAYEIQITYPGSGPASVTLSASAAGYNSATSSTTCTGNGNGTCTPATSNFNLTVAAPVNQAPAVAADSPSVTVVEGATATNTGTYSDSNASQDVTVTASVGSVTKTGTNNGTWSWSFGTNDGPAQSQTVTITADDGNGGVTSTTFTLAVTNVAPTAIFNAPASVNEGSSIALSLTGPADASSVDAATLQFAFDCGSGYGAFGATSSASCPTTDNGSLTVKGKVQDKDGGVNEYTATVVIDNVAPTATFNAPASVNEGSNIGLSLTAGADVSGVDVSAGFTYAFDCGSGYGSYSGINTMSCPTTDNGARAVKGKIRDKDGGEREYTATVTIDNVAPTATFNAPSSVNEGSNIALSLSAPSDPSSVDAGSLEYAFDCGDGAGYAGFSGTASASCPTTDEGSRLVKGKIKDKDGGVTEYSAAVTVNNIAPIVSPPEVDAAENQGATEGVSHAFALGSFTDPGADSPWSIVVNWGDSVTDESVPDATLPGTIASAAHTYGDDGTYTVTVTVTDVDGGTDSDSFEVTVANTAPTAILAGDTVGENSPATVGFSFEDDPSQDDIDAGFRYSFSCANDPIALATTYDDAGAASSTTCTFDDGSQNYTVLGRIFDKDDGYTDYTTTVHVNNVAPTPSISGAPATGPEGSAITLAGSATDPSAADTTAGFTFAWSVTKNGNPYASGATDGFTFTPDDNGSYVVTLMATDKDTGTGTTTAAISVTNVAPTATFTAPSSVDEGSGFTISLSAPFDPGSADALAGFQYAFDCGSGSFDLMSAADTATCTTTQDGVLTVRGQIRDKDLAITEYTATVTVANVAPRVDAGADAGIDEGGTFSQAGSFTDPGADTWSATVNYGDGSGSQPLALVGKTFSLSHTYADNGSYTVTVVVNDDDASGSDTLTVMVANVAPTIAISGATTVNEGSPYSLTLGVVTDPGADDVSSYVVHWGDGGSDTYTSGGAKSHTYLNGPAVRNITVDLVDEDGPFADAANDLGVTVANVAPDISSLMVDVDPVTRVATVSATYTDPGVLDTEDYAFAYAIDGVTLPPNATYADEPNDGVASDSRQLPAGCYVLTVTLTVTDSDGAWDSADDDGGASDIDVYEASFRDPIKGTERNIVKWGNVVPVKVVLVSSCTGTKITDQNLFITLAKKDADGETYSEENVVTVNVNQPDTNQQMRRVDSMYMYNLATKGYVKDTDYEIRIRVGSAAASSPIILQGYLIAKK